jgi:hypothetical protein
LVFGLAGRFQCVEYGACTGLPQGLLERKLKKVNEGVHDVYI